MVSFLGGRPIQRVLWIFGISPFARLTCQLKWALYRIASFLGSWRFLHGAICFVPLRVNRIMRRRVDRVIFLQ